MGQVKYTATHEWIEVDESAGVVGITERIQLQYATLVYIDLPSVGNEYEEEEPLARIDGANGRTFPVRAPVTGEIIEVNTELEDHPDLINQSPEGDGWICRMRIERPTELDALMDAEAYDEYEEEPLDSNVYMEEASFFDDDDDEEDY